ncbi:MAG: CapA family protein [Oscillospiraceae bacterium]|nr:CapA family protein [Oscillospiraceae bacterium]
MALDPEELKRQRQARAAQRAQQAAQRRKVFISLGVAAVVLIACGILIAALANRGKDPQEQTQPQETAAAVQDTTPATQTQEPTTTIRFVAAGDLNITSGVVAAGGREYDYTGAFMDVAHLLAEGDMTALNFEGNLCGAPYGVDSAPDTLAKALDKAGVDYLQLANSYSINRGLSGLADTVTAVRASGMEPLGAYASQEEAKQEKGYKICNIKGIRVGITAFTKGMDGLALPADGSGCVNVLYKDYDSTYQEVDTEGISAVLDAMKQEKPDVVIVLLHWGSEFNDTISTSQKSIVSLLQEKGVDAIIGTHSHYVQKMEFDPEAGTFVAYSLGDFFGDASRSGTEYSVILNLEITKDNETGETKVTGYDYTPIFTVTAEGAPVKVVRIREAMAAFEAGYLDKVPEETYQAMAYALTRIEARVAGD